MADGFERLRYGWEKATVEERVLFLKGIYELSAADADGVYVSAVVGRERLEPMVEVRWDDKIVQWAPERAIAHALTVIEAAEAARHDAFFVRFIEQRVGLSSAHGMQMLLEMRAWRQRRAELPEDPEGVTG